ncbi:MarR family transcriptional regulator [Kitasatospora sp. NPDC086791]|uniref:MarR family winged helix-turn-helix transcriptional regulator n=1 Tax=Kitasatospora sp. NPDC086791 TaxID=3155178 RepID=UPI00341B3AB0
MSTGLPPREDLVGALSWKMRRLSGETVLFHQAIADRLGISPTDLKCLDLASAGPGPITAGRLAEVSGLTSGAITGVINRLEKAGLVSREQDPNDRRKVIIVVSPSVPDRVVGLFGSMTDSMTELCSRYQDHELALVLDFVSRAADTTHQEAAKLQESIRTSTARS